MVVDEDVTVANLNQSVIHLCVCVCVSYRVKVTLVINLDMERGTTSL